MKRVNEYKKLFNATKDTDLKELKKTYRNLVKEWHPDKFLEGDDKKAEAEQMSLKIIDGYHFLVSIAPETIAANLEDFTKTITESAILDYKHKGNVLEITFLDDSTYEFFGVNKALFIKFNQSNTQMRFAKRSIFTLLYRRHKKAEVAA